MLSVLLYQYFTTEQFQQSVNRTFRFLIADAAATDFTPHQLKIQHLLMQLGVILLL